LGKLCLGPSPAGSDCVNPLTLLLLGLALSILRFVGGLLLGQQVKGSIPDYTAARARAAARRLPHDLAEQYEEEWLASLAALADKPISAIRYAHGLRRAANSISGERGLRQEFGARSKVARAADAALGLLMFLLVAPLVVAAAIAVAASSGTRILCREPAFGINGRKVYLLRFRVKDRDDRGITSIGRLLRRTGLAELPLLINLIRGEVALVGPPILRPIGVKMTRPRTPVRPGLASWERLARVGHIDLPVAEARARDERRTLKGDLELALRWMGFGLSVAAQDYYVVESECNCGEATDLESTKAGTSDP
jgi:lipopolysaccharide/colanic/teichoic acid biosynthesis glycosyltransferase